MIEFQIRNAARQLAESEKGREALGCLLNWLERSSGLSLDGRNQEAVLLLLQAAWGGYAGTVRDAMHAAVEAE